MFLLGMGETTQRSPERTNRRIPLVAWWVGVWLVLILGFGMGACVDIFFLTLACLMFPPLLIIPLSWPVVAVGSMVMAVKARMGVHRSGAACAGWLCVPLAGLLAFTAADPIFWWLWFQTKRPAYERVVDEVANGQCGKMNEAAWLALVRDADCTKPTLVVFRKVFFEKVAAIVYDESDEIGRPADKRSAEWKRRPVVLESVAESRSVYYRFGKHWYLVEAYYM